MTSVVYALYSGAAALSARNSGPHESLHQIPVLNHSMMDGVLAGIAHLISNVEVCRGRREDRGEVKGEDCPQMYFQYRAKREKKGRGGERGLKAQECSPNETRQQKREELERQEV